MTFFIDANLGEQIARGMQGFGEDVVHLKDCFDEGEADEVWLKHIGAKGWFLLTRDERIRWKPAERAALRTHNIGAFFLGGKNLKRWQLIEQVVRNWTRIQQLARSTQPPFAYRVPPHGTKINALEL